MIRQTNQKSGLEEGHLFQSVFHKGVIYMSYTKSLQEQVDDMQQEINKLTRERDIAKLAARYTEMGYGDLAEATAAASLDGDMDTFFRNQQTVMDARVKEAVADMNKPAKANPDSRNSRRKQTADSFSPIDNPFVAGFLKS